MLSPLAAFLKAVEEQPNQVYLRQPVNGRYQDYTWSEVSEISKNIAYQLRTLGVEKGDRVALWSKNCAQWVMADIAIMMAGAVCVPLYPGQSKSSAQYVLEHSGAKVLFLGIHDNESDVIDAVPNELTTIGFPYYKGPVSHQWDELAVQQADDSFKVDSPDLDDLMTLVYTSGTTGQPKGAMHTHGGFAFAANNLVEQVGMTNSDRTLSFLPLAHVAERVIVEGQSFYGWFSIAFVESLDTFNDNITEVRPTMFFAVPRLWSKFQEGVLAKLGGQEKLDKLLRIPLLSSFIKLKIKKSLGLDKSVRCGCGASPMPKALLDWYDRIGLPIYEGYGMTENLCYGTRNDSDGRSIGSAGRPYNRNEVKISEEGEILFKSPSLMKGYYKDPEKTQEAFVDGYYRTGDKGIIDENGFLHITGRLKELFKTTKGKYIAPAPIEALLTSHEYIEQACVMGSGRDQPIAVLELSETARGLDKAAVEKEVLDHLEATNSQLEHHEHMSTLVLTQLMWTVEAGLITPTLKIKREAVESRYLMLADDKSKGIIWGPEETASKEHQAA
ncbi:AMP-binding protein [Oceaniserpentilla sp. 4NH20-0058]|uniref:AMP-binding protein n=1 Tax=Oceaniserpentilla sp. 4NH20-0058 TaxID=3127660 RepID=UPI003104340B